MWSKAPGKLAKAGLSQNLWPLLMSWRNFSEIDETEYECKVTNKELPKNLLQSNAYTVKCLWNEIYNIYIHPSTKVDQRFCWEYICWPIKILILSEYTCWPEISPASAESEASRLTGFPRLLPACLPGWPLLPKTLLPSCSWFKTLLPGWPLLPSCSCSCCRGAPAYKSACLKPCLCLL